MVGSLTSHGVFGPFLNPDEVNNPKSGGAIFADLQSRRSLVSQTVTLWYQVACNSSTKCKLGIAHMKQRRFDERNRYMMR